MKIIYTLFFIIIFTSSVKAQHYSLTFEDTSVINQLFYTDSIIDPQGIWQIGIPNKPILDSAYSPPNAIVTFLDTILPPGSLGSFIITVPNVSLDPYASYFLTFIHRLQFDTAHSGGYVEFSVDTGQHWHPITFQDTVRPTCFEQSYWINAYSSIDTIDGQIISLPRWWDNVHKDTLPSGITCFTGTDSIWIFDTIAFPSFGSAAKTSILTQFMFRFTAFADSISAPSEGWLIDNISFAKEYLVCGGGINEINSSHLRVYPDPATDGFMLTVTDENSNDYALTIYDLSGRPILKQNFSGQQVEVQRSNIAAGAYFIQVTDKATQNTLQKRVVFE